MTATPATANVSLNTRALHDVAHAAVRAQRDDDGWWSDPLETALVAVADAQHSPGARRMAEKALEKLFVWLRSSEPRALGDDAAAAALTARAAFLLHGGSSEATTRAVELVGAACRGNELALAPLHVALAAWALAPLVEDRRQAPWDDIRSSLTRFSTVGVNEGLVLFARALADQAAAPADTRIAGVVALDRGEECLLLWLLNATVELNIEREAPDDALRPLMVRRTVLLDQLTAELTQVHLVPQEFGDFNPFDESERDDGETLNLFEATLLDLCLSGDLPQQALVTLAEVEQLGARDARRLRRSHTGAGVAAAVLVTAMAVPICILAEAPARLTIGVGLTLLALGIGLSLLVFLRQSDTAWPLQPLTVSLGLETVLGLFLITEGILDKALVDDELATIFGAAFAALPFLIQAVVTRYQKQ